MARHACVSYHRRMHNAAIHPSSLRPAGSPFLGQRHPGRRPAAGAIADACEIPASFTPDQANWIRALHRLHALNRPLALQQLTQRPPHVYSPAQVACIEQLLMLGPKDFSATLADAMER
jgi:hypothetical protein